MAVVRRHIHLFAHLDERFLPQSVGNHVLDADDFQVPRLGECQEFRQSGHRTVFVHDLHEGAGGIESCHVAEVDGGFGMSASAQHTVVLCVKRTDMSWSAEGLRLRCWVGQSLDGLSAVVGRDARRAALQLVDGDGEGCSEYRCVVLHLMRQVQLFAAFQGDGCAKYATGML